MPMTAMHVDAGMTTAGSEDESDRQSAVVSDSAALVQLRAYIQNAGFQRGQKLPPERVLGPELGLRRFELRKAMETLVDEGVLWRHVGKGTFMARPTDQSDQNDLTALARTISPVDVMRARLSLEPALAREAAIHAPASAIATLRLTMERSHLAGTWREYEALDNDFHRQIAEASGSVVLLALFDQLNTLRRMVAWGNLARTGARPPRSHSSFNEHDTITDAIEARDADAAHNAMRTHLRSVEDRLFRAS
ncbi:FadR/GntR family transcriptional regulator [Georhizobium sp. MAB10]|uniref:FadR/GntR family transcriptional regulator n=1 Tax=Georhizobium sp. MAB10 TaxID=3028319 RepID=UPI0038560AA3